MARDACVGWARRMVSTIDDATYRFRAEDVQPCGPPRRAKRRRTLTLKEARRRLRELQTFWDYAFAMGHRCSIGPDAQVDAVRREVAASYLRALLRAANGSLSHALFGYNHSQVERRLDGGG